MRVAVLGSCVTRDVWAIAGPSDAKPDLFLGRTSLASATLAPDSANPLASLTPLLPVLPPFTARSLRAELAKDALDQVAAVQPDLLVLDFIDERFDLLACGDALATESLELIESGLVAHPPLARARRIQRLSDEAWYAWDAGLLRLRRAWDAGLFGACRLALHACHWATEIETVEGRTPLPERCTILPGRDASCIAHGALLCRMYDRFATLFPAAVVIEPPPTLRVADAEHRWGPMPFHFVAAYYHQFADLIAAAGLPLWDQGQLA